MIIDTHTHFLDGDWLTDESYFPVHKMVEVQDRFGIQEMWMSSTGALAEDFVYYNRNIYEKTKLYSKRFINFATASPYFKQKALDDIRRCLEEYGFGGIKIHHWMQGGSVHCATTKRMIEMSIDYHVPVLFHDGTPPTSDTLQIAYLADLYPEAKIILGHAGMFDSYRCAIEACNTHDNIYLCISCSLINDAREIIRKARADRLLFGSDFGAAVSLDVFTNRRDTIEYACDDETLKNKIYYENAKRLMGE